METSGRRHLTARFFEVDSHSGFCKNTSESSDWQYRSECSLRIDMVRLRVVLDVLKEAYTPESDDR